MTSLIPLLLLILLGLSPGGACAFETLSRDPELPGTRPFTAVLAPIHADAPLLAASSHDLYKTGESKEWERLGTFGSAQNPIRKLLDFENIPGRVFILGPKGLWTFDLKTRRRRLVFRASLKNPLLCFAVDPKNPKHWLLGHARGIAQSLNGGKDWRPLAGFSKKNVSLAVFLSGHLFLGAGNNLYRLDSKSPPAFSKVLSLPGLGPAAEDTGFSESDPESVSNQDLVFDPLGEAVFKRMVPFQKRIWLATSAGIFETSTGGRFWKKSEAAGLPEGPVLDLLYSPNPGAFFARTEKGVYRYTSDKKRWLAIRAGFGGQKILDLALPKASPENLIAITPNGFLSYRILPDKAAGEEKKPTPGTPRLLAELLELEPSAQMVQKAVERYNGLGNGKIKRWQAASRISALFPTFSVGRDFSRSNNVDIDRGGTNTPDEFIAGPDDLDQNLNVDLSWDLGDFFYSSDQTSIDSRQKLMTELRDEMLAEATRLYFERRRLQSEVLMTPQAGETSEKMLRIQELTALLDGMTGSYFSGILKKIYRVRPELRPVWENPGVLGITLASDFPEGA